MQLLIGRGISHIYPLVSLHASSFQYASLCISVQSSLTPSHEPDGSPFPHLVYENSDPSDQIKPFTSFRLAPIHIFPSSTVLKRALACAFFVSEWTEIRWPEPAACF